ncbi:MAG: MBL fold metallo-hydrolase [Ruminococcus sp.]|nr:MBL fold metallo-hydrolase [Ruminococcus sp.]
MAKVVPLFSGSKGNSYFVGSSGEGVLIDAGRSAKQLDEALDFCGINPRSIGAVFVTHEHVDHCSALRVFAKKHGLKIYASAGTLTAMAEKGYISPENDCEVISDAVDIGNMRVIRCDTPHDARESCCFQVVTADDRRAAIATDLGVMTDSVRDLIRTSDFAVVESNHDIDMLRNGGYPYNVKQRILSDKGHLSNTACASELADFIRCGVFRLMLGHISENNNRPELAVNTSVSALKQIGMKRDLDFTISDVPAECSGKSILF